MSTKSALLTILTEKISTGRLVLPTLPEIAIKVRKAADDPDISLKDIGVVISQDPSLSARIISIANSAIRGRSVKVSDLNQAVTRIGLSQIKNVATALAMEQLFVSTHEIIRNEMNNSWKTTVSVTAHAIALFNIYSEETRDRTLNLDTLTLASMVHNIGVLPILTEAEKHFDVFGDSDFISESCKALSCKIGGMITQEWEFPQGCVDSALGWKSPLLVVKSKPSYTDFVRLAHIASGLAVADDRELAAYEEMKLIDGPGFFNRNDFKNSVTAALSVFA